MSALDIARKEECQLSLYGGESNQLPENQLGFTQLTDVQMACISGGSGPEAEIITNIVTSDPDATVVNISKVIRVPPGKPVLSFTTVITDD